MKVEPVDYEWWDWKAARSHKYGHDKIIEISSLAYRIYGWDVMTSVLIHEFGHCDLFNEGVCEGGSSDESLKVEDLANRRGWDLMPSHLVPEDYARHREFFLQSYLEGDWTKEKCLSKWREYQHPPRPEKSVGEDRHD
ncbi:MAG TPA: hypothetical protein VGK29_22775 [Paludibaculum sp.]